MLHWNKQNSTFNAVIVRMCVVVDTHTNHKLFLLFIPLHFSEERTMAKTKVHENCTVSMHWRIECARMNLCHDKDRFLYGWI